MKLPGRKERNMSKEVILKLDPFLYRKVQIVASAEKLSLDEAVIFLLGKVITPDGKQTIFRPAR